MEDGKTTSYGDSNPGAEKPTLNYMIMLHDIGICSCVGRAFVIASMKRATAYRQLDRAIKQGHIKENKLVVKLNSKSHQVYYYNITSAGLRYLSSNYAAMPVDYEWLKYIRVSTNRLKIKMQPLNVERMIRFLNISGTSFLMATIGAEMSDVFTTRVFKSEEEEGPCINDQPASSLDAIITDARRRYLDLNQGAQKSSTALHSMAFHNAIDIKRVLAEEGKDYSDFHGGRYTGILESQYRTVLVYVGSRTGMAWSQTASKPEISALHAYSVRYAKKHTLMGGENHGIMLVENAKSFYDLFTDKKKKRKREVFAERFDSFVVFPISNAGLENLTDYMDCDTATYEHELVAAAKQSGVYRDNASGHTRLFPLVNEDNTPMAIGTFIDAVKINLIRRIYAKTAITYGIICYDWQMDYYNRVAPEAVLMTIE